MKDKTPLPPLKTLPAFLAVAKHLSFSKAAKELHVTHSAISQSIRALETFLDTPLFDRGANKKVSLTPEGEHYFPDIQKALQLITSATEKQLGITTRNLLTINIPSTLALRWLIPRLPGFQSQYPELDLRLSTLGREVDFTRDNIDISLTYDLEESLATVHHQLLFDDSLVLAANPKCLPEAIQLDTLTQQLTCIYVDTELREQDWPLWCKTAGITEPDLPNRMLFQNSTQALQAAVNGVGMIVTHASFIMDDLQSGQLKLASDIQHRLSKRYYLTCSKEKAELKNVVAFFDWLQNEANTSLNQ